MVSCVMGRSSVLPLRARDMDSASDAPIQIGRIPPRPFPAAREWGNYFLHHCQPKHFHVHHNHPLPNLHAIHAFYCYAVASAISECFFAAIKCTGTSSPGRPTPAGSVRLTVSPQGSCPCHVLCRRKILRFSATSSFQQHIGIHAHPADKPGRRLFILQILQAFQPFELFFPGNLERHCRGPCSGTIRVAEGKTGHEVCSLHGMQRIPELSSVSRKADDRSVDRAISGLVFLNLETRSRYRAISYPRPMRARTESDPDCRGRCSLGQSCGSSPKSCTISSEKSRGCGVTKRSRFRPGSAATLRSSSGKDVHPRHHRIRRH